MTEKLFTGTLNHNQNKNKNFNQCVTLTLPVDVRKLTPYFHRGVCLNLSKKTGLSTMSVIIHRSTHMNI